jgi:hypothetical protein
VRRHRPEESGTASGSANLALAAGGRPRADFTPLEVRRLAWLRATHLAEAHLERAGLAADRSACQHLAYALWLRATGRISEEMEAAGGCGSRRHQPAWRRRR